MSTEGAHSSTELCPPLDLSRFWGFVTNDICPTQALLSWRAHRRSRRGTDSPGLRVKLGDNLLATSENSFDDWGVVGILRNDGTPSRSTADVLPIMSSVSDAQLANGHCCFGASEPTPKKLDLTETTSYKFRTYKKLWLPRGEKLGIVLPTTSRRSGLARRRSYLKPSSVFARRGHEFVPVWGVPCRDA